MAWTIQGEAGKTLDATARTPAALALDSCQLRLQSLASDTLTWTARTDNAAGAGTIVPDFGQIVELYNGATRKFRGHVTAVKVGMESISVTVEGPWWWMTRIALTGDAVDATGGTAERPSFVFPTQGLKTSLQSLLDRMITNGVPMTRGAIATMYPVPKISLSNMSCAAALAELLRWVPDAVFHFDYSGTVPDARISRRKAGLSVGSMAATTYAIGTDPITLEGDGISPRLDLEVAGVSLKYVQRQASTGKPQWAAQDNGATTPGKLQIVTISGPEIVAFLPKDDFDSVVVRTTASPGNGFVSRNDSTLAGLLKTSGSVMGGVASSMTRWGYFGAGGTVKTSLTENYPELSYTKDNGDVITSTTGKYLVTSADLPQWAKDLYNGIDVQVSGTWLAQWKDSEQGVGVGWSEQFAALRAGAITGSGFENSTSSGPTKDYQVDWAARPFSFRGCLIDTAFSSSTTIYKPWDYDYLTPPADLAQNLKEAQNWVPWEGTLVLVSDDVSGDSLLPYLVNLTGTLTPCATMGAMLRTCTHDIARGRTTLDLGAPARTDFGSLVSRIRRDPGDNIVYL